MFSGKSSSRIVLEVAWSFHNSPRTGSGHSNKILLHCVLTGPNAWGFLSVKRFLQMYSVTGVIRITWCFGWFLEGQLRGWLIRSFEMDRVTPVRGAFRCLHFIWPLIKSFHDHPFLPFFLPPEWMVLSSPCRPLLRWVSHEHRYSRNELAFFYISQLLSLMTCVQVNWLQQIASCGKKHEEPHAVKFLSPNLIS